MTITIRSRRSVMLAAAAALVLAGYVTAGAQGAYVYPAKGQSPQQQAQDEAEYRAWAAQQGDTAAPPPIPIARSAPAWRAAATP